MPEEGTFRSFWSIDGAWGTVSLGRDGGVLELLGGAIALTRLGLPDDWSSAFATAKVIGRGTIGLKSAASGLVFEEALHLIAGQKLVWSSGLRA